MSDSTSNHTQMDCLPAGDQDKKRPTSSSTDAKIRKQLKNVLDPIVIRTSLKVRRPENVFEIQQVYCIRRLLEENESRYTHNSSLLDMHPDISSQHRARVLLWTMEICQGTNITKDTLFTAIDIFDRFLIETDNVGLLETQLLSVSALYIAAKLKQPKSTFDARQFSIMTDEVYSPTEILNCEEDIRKVLDWRVYPATVVAWNAVYIKLLKLQVEEMKNKISSKILFNYCTRLLYLSMLDCKSLNFKYSILAACALYFIYPCPQKIYDILLPELDQDEFFECLRWMVDFYEVLSEAPPLPANNLEEKEVHLAPCSTINLNMLEKALNMPKST